MLHLEDEMENRNSAKPVVEAGILIAITFVISVFVNIVPLIGIIGVVALPIPIAILYIRHNFKIAFTSLLISTLLISIILGLVIGVVFACLYGPIGIVLGYSFKKRIKVSRSIFLITIVFIIGLTLIVSFLLLFIDKKFFVNMINVGIDSVKQYYEQSLKIMENQGRSADIESLKQQIESIKPELFLYTIPAGIALNGFLFGFLNYAFTRSILKKLRYEVQELTPFEKVYIDNRLGALIIIITCLGVILNRLNSEIGNYIFASAVIVLQFTLLVIGSAVVYYYAKNKFNMKRTPAIIITVALVLPPMSSFITYIGFADLIFDFRKVDPNRLFKGRNNQQ